MVLEDAEDICLLFQVPQMTGKETPVPCVDHCITRPVNLLRRALLAVATHGPARLQKEPSNASARLQWYGQITAV